MLLSSFFGGWPLLELAPSVLTLPRPGSYLRRHIDANVLSLPPERTRMHRVPFSNYVTGVWARYALRRQVRWGLEATQLCAGACCWDMSSETTPLKALYEAWLADGPQDRVVLLSLLADGLWLPIFSPSAP